MSHDTSARPNAPKPTAPCGRCDLLLGIDSVHVERVDRGENVMTITVSTSPGLTGCPDCGVIAVGRGRRVRVLRDVPGDVRVELRWRQRVWRCEEPGCARRVFVEDVPALVARRGSITRRAISWAIGQLRREHATVRGLARQIGTSWKAFWRALRPVLEDLVGDEGRFAGVRMG